jgi:hypothetical protein
MIPPGDLRIPGKNRPQVAGDSQSIPESEPPGESRRSQSCRTYWLSAARPYLRDSSPARIRASFSLAKRRGNSRGGLPGDCAQGRVPREKTSVDPDEPHPIYFGLIIFAGHKNAFKSSKNSFNFPKRLFRHKPGSRRKIWSSPQSEN